MTLYHMEREETFWYLFWSALVNSFNVCKFCNNPIQVEEDNDKPVGLAFLLKIVYQNEEYLKSKINSLVNMTKMVDFFRSIFYLFWRVIDWSWTQYC